MLGMLVVANLRSGVFPMVMAGDLFRRSRARWRDELVEIRNENTKSSGEQAVTIADLFRDAFLRRLTFIAA
ncbi:hypothetical protein RvY_16934 [Ramazzottius varieornatus]|uniref:Uncharacterized protein n=1 Tax=Ramazzottius varieornatus TaxID=947166 RepID=A0A1D1W197_RAMVA|nr:hypothetical protein RvY_16934 [Ramazzottius varieornatus]